MLRSEAASAAGLVTASLPTQAPHDALKQPAPVCVRCSLRRAPRLWLLLQAQHDYLQGNYPVVREDAAQMCALQIQAEAGPTLADDLDVLDTLVEKFVVKQASCLAAAGGPQGNACCCLQQDTV